MLVNNLQIIVLIMLTALSIRADETAQILQQRGLVRQDKQWLLPLEIRLQERLEVLDKQERKLVQARQEVEQQLAAREQLQAQYNTAQANAARLQTVIKTAQPSPFRAMLEREQQETKSLIARLKPTLPDLETLGSQAPMKGQLASYSALLTEFTVNWLEAQRWAESLPNEYQKFQSDAAIQAAIRSGQKLGPKSLTVDQKHLTQLKRAWAIGSVPVYREGKHLRLSVILNEERPVTLTWQPDNELTLLPWSVWETLDWDEAKLGPAKTITVQQQSIKVRTLVLQDIRVNTKLRQQLSVGILPPELEHWGGQLGTIWQSELGLRFEPTTMQVLVDQLPRAKPSSNTSESKNR
jgi:hypothetical protein